MLTLDKDFWQIAVHRRDPLKQSGVVLFRVHPEIPENLGPLVGAFVEANSWPSLPCYYPRRPIMDIRAVKTVSVLI